MISRPLHLWICKRSPWIAYLWSRRKMENRLNTGVLLCVLYWRVQILTWTTWSIEPLLLKNACSEVRPREKGRYWQVESYPFRTWKTRGRSPPRMCRRKQPPSHRQSTDVTRSVHLRRTSCPQWTILHYGLRQQDVQLAHWRSIEQGSYALLPLRPYGCVSTQAWTSTCDDLR